jgi:hypothetical protein
MVRAQPLSGLKLLLRDHRQPVARSSMSEPGQGAFGIVDPNMFALLMGTDRELPHPANLMLLLKRIARSELAAKPSRTNGGDGNLAALLSN